MTVNIHASCVMLDRAANAFDAPAEAGILLLGDSGSGKSDLVLRLIERGARLVSDDRTELFVHREFLMARAPANLASLLEIRGLGIVGLPHAREAHISLAVRLSDGALVSRLPEAERFDPPAELGAGQHIHPPMLRLSAFEASTPAKIVVAAAAHAKALFRDQRKAE